MSLTAEQKAHFDAPLPRDVVKQKPGKNDAPYVDGFYVIQRLNTVFGYDGWSVEYGTPTIHGTQRPIVYVPVTLRAAGVIRQDIGTCIAANDKPDALDTALKGAYTDGLKRAARCFGDSFGLALYDKTRAGIGISTTALAMLEDIKALATLEEVNDWARGNKEYVAKLRADEMDVVKGACAAKRLALSVESDETTAPSASGPVAYCVGTENRNGQRFHTEASTNGQALAQSTPTQDTGKVLTFHRVTECETADELVVVRISLWPGLSEGDRKALMAVEGQRVKSLGLSVEAMKSAYTAVSGESRNALDWKVVADVLAAVRHAESPEALKAIVGTFGAKVKALPDPLKARCNAAREFRLKALSPSSESTADALIAEAGKAASRTELERIHARMTEAIKELRLTPEHAERVVEALNERDARLAEAA